ncbi:MAG: hypothetical protein M5T52_21945 [Ignavibacteriaceae bacterium]|nr:hypothetical protein [Ignavibacteriaceae bacterium]
MLYFIIGDDELFKSNVSDETSLDTNILYFMLLLIAFIFIIVFIRNYYKQKKLKEMI